MRRRSLLRIGAGSSGEAETLQILEAAATNVADCAHHLHDLLRVLPPGAAHVEAVRACQEHGDELHRTIWRHPNPSLPGSLDPKGIRALAGRMRRAVDAMGRVADTTDALQLGQLPAAAEDITAAVTEAAEALPGLVHALGARMNPVAVLSATDALESRVDDLHRSGLAELYAGVYTDLTVLKLKEILDGLRQAMAEIAELGAIVEAATIGRP
jgi:uncharacterized protein